MLAVCVSADVVLTQESAALVGTFVAAPFVAALFARPAATAVVGVAAIGAAALSPSWNMGTGDSEQVVRLVVIARRRAASRSLGASLRWRSAGRSERLRLLDSVGAVADGSLPLRRDAAPGDRGDRPGVRRHLHGRRDPRRARLADRHAGSAAARMRGAIQDRMRRRPPALPAWLVKGERSWRDIPEWWPRIRDEELRRMANSPDDLEFLRSLGLRSSVVIPIRARDRNLGALTLLTAWSGAATATTTCASRRSSPAGSAWRSTTRACSPTSRASSGGWTP